MEDKSRHFMWTQNSVNPNLSPELQEAARQRQAMMEEIERAERERAEKMEQERLARQQDLRTK